MKSVRTLSFLVLTSLGAAALSPGCVEESPELSPTEREALHDQISSTPPHPQHALDIQFENKVALVGYDVDVETVRPGQPFHVTWYWHVERRLGPGWAQFTHLADANGTDRVNQDHEGVLRERYPASRWRADEYLSDTQTFTLPADWSSNRVVVYQGFWNEDHRLQVVRGPNDGENRARVLSLPVEGATTATAPDASALPTLAARRASGPIVIDGRLDEADWSAARPSNALVNTLNGSAGQPNASVKALWDDTALYVAFDVGDDFLHSTLEGRDAHLWEQDCVEIMADPDGDGENYFELQVAPTGAVFDTHYDTRRQPQPFGHVDWNADIEARVSTRGTVNDDADDQGYTVELRIPYASFHHGDGPAAPTASVGASWRFNFYVMDTRRDGGQRAVGWSPTLEGDFHVPRRFGRVELVAADAPAVQVGPAAALVGVPTPREAEPVEAPPTTPR